MGKVGQMKADLSTISGQVLGANRWAGRQTDRQVSVAPGKRPRFRVETFPEGRHPPPGLMDDAMASCPLVQGSEIAVAAVSCANP